MSLHIRQTPPPRPVRASGADLDRSYLWGYRTRGSVRGAHAPAAVVSFLSSPSLDCGQVDAHLMLNVRRE